MHGGVSAAYQLVAAAEWSGESEAWLSAVGAPPPGWHEPDPFMELSVGGLRFDDVDAAKVGDLALLSIRLPTSPTIWHATARVVRVDEIPVKEREEPELGHAQRTHRVAIEFLTINPKAIDALFEYTELLQNLEISVNADLDRPLKA
ncbi:PilZ domain-containing protein [Myxococcota bacterium]|nr:PilZ domain-containing protein [Myxococcota bacterium]